MTEFFNQHESVLLTEVVEHLAIRPQGIYLDATFGRGGHAKAILQALGPTGRLLAMDKDPEAIAYACQHFSKDKRFTIKQGTFAGLAAFMAEQDVMGKVDGILFDLGVSSPQLDDPERGFSFARSGKLDMRMDTSQGMDAATWINSVAEEDLANVLWKYGEERFSRRIAKAIVAKREEQAFVTTGELADVIKKAIPMWQKGKHPATRSFQAIRIFLNRELEDLEIGLTQSLQALKVGGRLAVISFHSLEDRIVKQFMQKEEQGQVYPIGLPIKHKDIQLTFKRLSRAIKPSVAEIAVNPRARSAVLRIGEKQS